MAKKSLRNTVGIASLTALALTMVACGGSSSSTPAVATNVAPTAPIIVGSTSGITLHPATYNLSATDAEGEQITFLVTGATTQTVGPTSGSGSFTWTPSATQTGDVTITAVAQDAGTTRNSSPSNLVVHVQANRPAQFLSQATSEKHGANAINWTTFQVAAQDPDGDDVRYTVPATGDASWAGAFKDNNGNTTTGSIAIDAKTGTVTFTGTVPTGATSVTATFVVTATDKLVGSAEADRLGATSTQTVTLTYYNDNHAPVILTSSLPSLPLNHYIPVSKGGSGFAISATDQDTGDNASLHWTMTSTPATGLKLTTATGPDTAIVTDANWHPSMISLTTPVSVTVTVTDQGGLSTTRQLSIPIVADSIPTLNSNVYTETVSGVEAFNTSKVKWDITDSGSIKDRRRFHPAPVDWLSFYTPSEYSIGHGVTDEADHAADTAATDLAFSNFPGAAYSATTWTSTLLNDTLPSAGWNARTVFRDNEGDGVAYSMQGGSVFVSGTYHTTVGQTFTITDVDGATSDTTPSLGGFSPIFDTWANRGEYPGIDPTTGTILWRPVLFEDPNDTQHSIDNAGNYNLALPAVWSFTVQAKEKVWNPTLNAGVGGYDAPIDTNQGAQNYSVKVQPNNRPFVGALTTIEGSLNETNAAVDGLVSNVSIGGGTNVDDANFGRPSIQEPESKRYDTAAVSAFPYDTANSNTAKWRWFFAPAGGTSAHNTDVQMYDPDMTNQQGHQDSVYADVPALTKVVIGGVDTTPVPFIAADVAKIYNPWVDAGGTAFTVEWGPSRTQYLLARMAGFSTVQLPVNVWDQYERQNNSGAEVYPMFGTVRIANARTRYVYDQIAETAKFRTNFYTGGGNEGDWDTNDDATYNFQYLPLVKAVDNHDESTVGDNLFNGVMPQSGTDGSGNFFSTSWISLLSTELHDTDIHNTNPLNDETDFNKSIYAAAVAGSGKSITSDWRTYSMVGGVPTKDPQHTATGVWADHEARAHVIPSNSPYMFALIDGTNMWDSGYYGSFPIGFNVETTMFNRRGYPFNGAGSSAWSTYYGGQRQGEIDYQRAVPGRAVTTSTADYLADNGTQLRWSYSWPTNIDNGNLGRSAAGNPSNVYELGDVMQIAVPNMGGNARWFFTGNNVVQNVTSWGRRGMSDSADTVAVLGTGTTAGISFTAADTTPFHTVTDSIWIDNTTAGILNLPVEDNVAPSSEARLPFTGSKGYNAASAGLGDPVFWAYGGYNTNDWDKNSNPGLIKLDSTHDRVFFTWMKQDLAVTNAWGTWGFATLTAGSGYTATGGATTMPAFSMADGLLSDTFAQVSFAKGALPGKNQAANAGLGTATETSGLTNWQRSQWANLAPAMGPQVLDTNIAYGTAIRPLAKTRLVNPTFDGAGDNSLLLNGVDYGFYNVDGANIMQGDGQVRDSAVIYGVRDRSAAGANFGLAGIEPGSPVLAQWWNLTTVKAPVHAAAALSGDDALDASTVLTHHLDNMPVASFPTVTKAFYSPFIADAAGDTQVAGFKNVLQLKMNFLVGMNYPNVAPTNVFKMPATIEQAFPIHAGPIVDPTCTTTADHKVDVGRPILGPARLARIMDYKTNYTQDLERVRTVIDLVNSDPYNETTGAGAISNINLPLDIANHFGTGSYALDTQTSLNMSSTNTLAWQASVNNQVLPSGYVIEMFWWDSINDGAQTVAPTPNLNHTWRVGHIGGQDAIQTLHMPAPVEFTDLSRSGGWVFYRIRTVWMQDGAGNRIDFEKEPERQGIPYAYTDFVTAPVLFRPAN